MLASGTAIILTDIGEIKVQDYTVVGIDGILGLEYSFSMKLLLISASIGSLPLILLAMKVYGPMEELFQYAISFKTYQVRP